MRILKSVAPASFCAVPKSRLLVLARFRTSWLLFIHCSTLWMSSCIFIMTSSGLEPVVYITVSSVTFRDLSWIPARKFSLCFLPLRNFIILKKCRKQFVIMAVVGKVNGRGSFTRRRDWIHSWGTERIFAAKIERSWVGYFNNFCIKVRSCSWLITKINYSQIQTQCNPL